MIASRAARRSHLARLMSRTLLATSGVAALALAQPAQAQSRVVSVCSGVSLPPSVVTGIMAPVVTGIATPTETTINSILNVPLLRGLLPPLSLDATGLLSQAAAGNPITLQVLATDGTIVGPTDQCRATADAFTLKTPAGVAIGGNQITGLGANGAAAFASDIDAIAFGNNARAEAGAVGSIALGANSRATAANSVALGAGSIAARGSLAGYTATGLVGPQASVGEVSVGTPGALRQLTNVAAGSAASDAATVGQVDGVLARVTALDAAAVRYDGAAHDRVTLGGAAGTTIGNVAPGALGAGSTEAVNGAQLFATNQQVGLNAAAIGALDTRFGASETRLTTVEGAVAANTANYLTLSGQVTTNTGAIAGLTAGLANQPLRYADAATPTVPNGGVPSDETTLVGASGGTVGLHNLRAGTLAPGSTDAVNGDQLYATNQTVGGNTAAIGGLDTRLGVTTAGLRALDAVAVRYDAADRARVTFGGTGGTLLDNIAPGTLAASSRQAVNGAQLFATNAMVAANAAAIAGLSVGAGGPVRYSSAAAPTTPNGGTVSDDVTLAGSSGAAVALHNVAAGVLATESTDAVNGGQLFATNQTVAGNTAGLAALQSTVTTNGNTVATLSGQVAVNSGAIAGLTTAVANQPLRYADAGSPTTPNGGVVSDDATLAGRSGGTVGLHNVTAGVVATGSTDAINGGQLAATDARVTANTTAITGLTGLLTASPVSPVQYSNPATPTQPNGGMLTNDVTLVGANLTAPVAIHNVAAGAMTPGSTDAVNGQQLLAVATTANSAVQYDRDAAGNRSDRVTLIGGTPGAAVTVANVAAGTVAAGSTQAVNGGQLYATGQVAQQAATIAANSVQYDPGRTGVSLAAAGAPPVALHNVAAGTAATDAVNVGQLQASMQGAMASLSDNVDQRMSALAAVVDFDIKDVRREIGAGTSAALAAAALPQATEPGRSMIAIGGGTYRGGSAVAFGASTFLADGHSIVRLGATYDNRGKAGANAGYGYQF